MSIKINVPAIIQINAVLLGLTGLSTGIQSVVSANSYSETFGLPTATLQPSPFIYAVGCRNISSSLVLLAFSYQRKFSSVGTLLLCGMVTSFGDAGIVYRYGVKAKAYGHLIGGVIVGCVGGYLYLM